MYNVHPNKQLRGFSVASEDGKSKITPKDIQEMSNEDYLALRLAIRKRGRIGTDASNRKQVKKLLRKLSIARKKGLRSSFHFNHTFEKSESMLLDSFYPERCRRGVWKPFNKRKTEVSEIDLDVFSLIDRPDETFEKFEQIAQAECDARILRLNFTDGMCFDMGAYLLLALMKKDLPHKQLQGGRITDEVAQVLDAVGLADFMNIVSNNNNQAQPTLDGIIPAGTLEDVMPFKLTSGGGLDAKNLAKSEQRDEKVANNFVTTLKDSWVARHNPKQNLSEEACSKIRDVMTELFDNALRHADPDTETGEWHTVGVLQKKKNLMGQDLVVCNLAIINFGLTIAQTLDLAADDIKDQINKYVAKHSNFYSEDTLKTVCAMQDKISRIDPHNQENATLNGVGLMDSVLNVMDPLFGCNIEEYKPRFTLISGRSWLSVTSPPLKTKSVGERQLAFNEENDISRPPDQNCVKTLARNFPGTIVSLRFVIGASDLERINELADKLEDG